LESSDLIYGANTKTIGDVLIMRTATVTSRTTRKHAQTVHPVAWRQSAVTQPQYLAVDIQAISLPDCQPSLPDWSWR